MSVSQSALWAYGYKVEGNEDYINEVCGRHGTTYSPYGNAYSGDVFYIICTENLGIYIDEYNSSLLSPIPLAASPEDVGKIKATVTEITGKEPKDDPQSYVGLYIY